MRRVAIFSAFLLTLAGCGDGHRLVAVSGRVNIDGKPAPNVHVQFEPIGSADNPNPGPGSIGITDAEGVYRLRTVWPQDDGAVVGKHQVRINLQQPLASDAEPATAAELRARDAALIRQLPARYNEKSELTFEVPADGTDSADFDVTSK
ncbi:MAG: hypothetical protein HY000_13655 [Planctomycetes bacterium]|nr:hypothetical protein [Planctomycetota bacterium]